MNTSNLSKMVAEDIHTIIQLKEQVERLEGQVKALTRGNNQLVSRLSDFERITEVAYSIALARPTLAYKVQYEDLLLDVCKLRRPVW